jgi:hypothetical protein
MPVQYLVRTLTGATRCLTLDDAAHARACASDAALTSVLRQSLADNRDDPSSCPRGAYARCRGRRRAAFAAAADGVVDDVCVEISARVVGGKGGFGTLLRTTARRGAQTTNFDACRDAHGRRLRRVNGERKIAEWEENQAERDAEKEAQKYINSQASGSRGKKLREVEEKERAAYAEESERAKESVNDAVTRGLKEAAAIEASKRKAAAAIAARHGKDVVDDSDEGSDSDDLDAAALLFPTKKKAKVAVEASVEAPAHVASTSKPATPVKVAIEEVALPKVVEEEEEEDDSPLDLQSFDSASALEGVGLDKLKKELMSRQLKCGGTLAERAARLFLLRDKSRADIDAKHWAK